MTQVQAVATNRTNPKTKDDDALARIRVATQQLHAAISDAATKRGEAMKSELKTIPAKAKAVVESVKASLGTQSDVTKTHLMEAIKCLESTEKHVAEGLNASGHAFEASVRQAIGDAHAAARRISEAVAAKRAAESTNTHP
jgi:ElaB/YqjD/DUF883 family membrane-anchored ribosome-binding protein